MEVGPEAKGRGLLNLGEHPGVGMEEECTGRPPELGQQRLGLPHVGPHPPRGFELPGVSAAPARRDLCYLVLLTG